MATDVDDIDALYQVPLSEFTAARNALAKRLGRTEPPIKDLEKPSVPAWAVNQLYWRQRPVYNRLIQAAERLRAEHRKLLAGKPADHREAEKLHREAIRAATDAVRDILTEANQAASPATMTAVGETLAALPTADAPGRLAKPLRPMGFEALSGVTVRPSATPLRLVTRPAETARPAARTDPKEAAKEAALEAKRAAAAAKKEAEAAKREAEAARQEAAKEKERQRLAEAELRRAEAAVERAEAAFAKAEREAEQRRQERDAAREALRKLRRAT
jgi:colicin import membrane protein